jgi:hypothetical protein
MEYQLEIYRPGSSDSDACIETFVAATAFLPIRIGDLLDTKSWKKKVEWPLLRVVTVEHSISETSAGIDPTGRITHRILLYTESVPDTAETRCKSLGNTRESRP